MSSNAAVNGVKTACRVIPVHKKYTLQSSGIWERIRSLLAISPARSNGVPLNAQFRNPTPGSNEPFSFIDPVTIPAGDIADNPYWKRDSRRSYPQLSFVNQQDMVGLLKLGSRTSPKKELIGEAGSKAIVEIQKDGEAGLAAYFNKEETAVNLEAFSDDGLPPLPSGASSKKGDGKYQLTEENSYPESYPCRTFH
ncbi:NADH-ubiquinone oxidoreductase 21.3 kDa subunit [Golovinomyces cichoracearum]|uniref:NADH-ubiquinone oxidoreductase 21.3 kDa subunit n=1 Tax=Golovinomyces cichoracearum TaxID=62708 RepID=A0A420HNA2_9PEZI|nr:NADH-ubiquinone oxidoreductase 21.3 kDa subunit [Golovinomyces cichoracearum]